MATYEQPMLYSVDFSGCTVLSSRDAASLSATFIDALRRAGATIVETVSHEFSGKGLTCVLILAESHAVLHTWPETGIANVDIFSCSSRLRAVAAIEALKTAFGARDVSMQTIARADGHRRTDG